MSLAELALTVIAVAGVPAALAQDPAAAPEVFPSFGLTLTFAPAFTQVEREEASADETDLGAWQAKLGSKDAWIWLEDWSEGDWEEPGEIIDQLADFFREEEEPPDPLFRFDEQKWIAGPYGSVPYVAVAWRAVKAEGTTSAASVEYFLAGVANGRAYVLSLTVEPAPSPPEAQLVLDFFAKGIAYAGPKREPKWTDDEVRARWKEDVPDSDAKSRRLEKIIRTDHYVVLTNSSGGKLFATKMEEFYATIRKVYPFDEVAGQRLMPVFLFQTADEFREFLVAGGMSEENAQRAKGVAYDDLYTTWYEAPNDPVHIHEATHQVFGNRLYLNGGGSWFQEGVAEYVETRPNDRNNAARLVKEGKHTPLREFFAVKSLLFSSGENDDSRASAADQYKQAALLIEFLRESKFGKDKFQTWLHAVGNVARNDLTAIENATRAVYSVDVAGLEKAFAEYCKKR